MVISKLYIGISFVLKGDLNSNFGKTNLKNNWQRLSKVVIHSFAESWYIFHRG